MFLGIHLDEEVGELTGDSMPLSQFEQSSIKKGLSKYYHGKSRSFTSMSEVSCVEDLAKKERPNRRGTNTSCRSYGGEFDDSHEPSSPPGPCSRGVQNKSSRGSCASSAAARPPPIPLQKNF